MGFYAWYRVRLLPVPIESEAPVTVTIPEGTSVRRIGELLAEKELIRSPWAFRIRTRARGLQNRMQAGSFLLNSSMTVDAIIDAITGGTPLQMKITIPEGFTVEDIDRLVAAKGLAATGAILACAKTCDFSSLGFLPSKNVEGYLFPDTYFVSAHDFAPKAFLTRLLETFRKRVIEALDSDVKESKRSWADTVTMASLIEEETRTTGERPIVSGILWKRFDAHSGLDVDAALRYIVDKPTAPLTKQDLALNSPYNLRRYRGLPPSAIANPGLESIRAAIHPQESPYWYYLHDAKGEIHYALTNDEHNVHKAQYLR